MVATSTTMDEKALKALEMRQNGRKIEEIAGEFGVDKSTVSRWLHRVAPDPQQLQEENELLHEELQQSKVAMQKVQMELQRVATREEELQSQLQQTEMLLHSGASELQRVKNEFQQVADELQQTKTWLQNSKEQVQSLETALQAKKNSWFVDLFTKKWFQTFIVLVGSISTACAITAPIFMHVNIPSLWAYCLALYVDIAAFIFILNNRHKLGKWFAFNITFQVLIKLGCVASIFFLMGYGKQSDVEQAWMVLLISFSLAVSVGLASYGFADLILSLNKDQQDVKRNN